MVIGLVSNQFAAQALVVPVNPFRPTFEMMIRHPESGDLVSLAAATSRGSGGVSLAAATSRGSGGVSQPGDPARIRRPVAGATEEDGPPPVPKYSFGGIMQRPDGRVAAYLKNSLGGGRFLVKGDEFAGCRVLDATADGIVLRQPWSTRPLARNDPPVGWEETRHVAPAPSVHGALMRSDYTDRSGAYAHLLGERRVSGRRWREGAEPASLTGRRRRGCC